MKEIAKKKKIIFIANSSWYIFNFRLPLLFEINKLYEIIIIAPKDKYTKILKSHGFIFYQWDLNRKSINIFSELKSLLSLFTIIKKLKPDLIHNYNIKPIIYGTLAARINKTEHIINSITGLGNLFLDNKLITKLLRFILKPIIINLLNTKKVHLIFQNKDDKLFFEKSGIRYIKNSEIIPGSGVDMSFFKSKKIHKFNFPIRILFPSRIIKEKGITELITAYKQLIKKGILIELLIAGKIDYGNRSHIENNLKDYLLNNKKIYLLGHVEDMKELYEKVDIVVLPSWREGLSKSLIEAGSMSKTIITTNVPGCKEIIDHGVNGILVPPRDPKALENAIENLVKDLDYAEILSKKIRKKIETNFEVSLINKLTLSKYKKIFIR